MATRPAEPPRAHELLERERAFATLDQAVLDARTGRGRLVLVRGEAGTGKTELVRRFCDTQRPSSRVLWGACESLFTPRPLAPLVEIAQETGGALEAVLSGDAKPHDVTAELEHELASRFTILVLDDLHWADEATLDVVRMLARRIERVDTLVVGMLRDEQLEPSHPLRLVLGELATDGKVDRIVLEPLSPAAVAYLAAPWEMDAADLFRKTGGNPFYVIEALLAYDEPIPATVRDAVLARVARLSPSAQRLLELVAVAQPETELWLIEQEAQLTDLDECLSSSMLAATQSAVRFRHELARLAVESSITPVRALELHRTVLSALEAPNRPTADLSRLAHHAEGAGDRGAVLRLAPAAARHAASLGAHREAAAQYARALRFAAELPLDQRAGILTLHSFECYLTTQDDQALESIAAALDCHRGLGDEAGLGAMLRWQSLLLMNVGRQPEADGAVREAVAVLERQQPSQELALAYCTLGAFATLHERADDARSSAARGRELAEQLGSVEGQVAALGTLGVCDVWQGDASGWELLDEALALGYANGLEVQVGRTYVLHGMAASRERSLARMESAVLPAIAFCEERDLEMWGRILLAMRAWLELERGDWDACATTIAQVLAHNCTLSSMQANIVQGLLRARRGDPDPWSPLGAAAEIAARTEQLWWTGQVAMAMAETAWLARRPELIEDLTAAPFASASERRASWPVAELAYWRRQAGIEVSAPPSARGPYAALLRGDWAEAAAQWADAGCPYEAALALAQGDDEAQRRALEELNRLSAPPAARIVARRLRQRGLKGVARGPRSATRESPLGLTRRETEVLELLAEPLRNSEIADRLVVSRRTIDHHVSSILRKLGVRTRGEAVAAARRLGLLDDP